MPYDLNKGKKFIKNILLFFVVSIFIIILSKLPIIFYSQQSLDNNKFGIIDGNVSKMYNNISYINIDTDNCNKKTHGDYLCEFINNIYKDYHIYYYNAEINGYISDEGLLNALNWMKKKGITKINISLSSKIYSSNIQQWILNNKSSINIFASYSNKSNSYDYPAMYYGVTGSIGNYDNSVFSIKKIDKIYNSYYILDIRNFTYYKGNSYLSLVSMFSNF